MNYRLLRQAARYRLATTRTCRNAAPDRPPSLADYSLSLSRGCLPPLRPWLAAAAEGGRRARPGRRRLRLRLNHRYDCREASSFDILFID